jgi:hypothetical protein
VVAAAPPARSAARPGRKAARHARKPARHAHRAAPKPPHKPAVAAKPKPTPPKAELVPAALALSRVKPAPVSHPARGESSSDPPLTAAGAAFGLLLVCSGVFLAMAAAALRPRGWAGP